jgi:hypothetical protein
MALIGEKHQGSLSIALDRGMQQRSPMIEHRVEVSHVKAAFKVVNLNRGPPMASARRPKGSCPNFNRGCRLVLGTGCTLGHWSCITAPFLAATGD